jgi:hypothetical protein
MAMGYCSKHYARMHKHGSPSICLTGQGHVNADEYRIIMRNGIRYKEHRWVMEQSIKRKLYPWETVHHINGDTLDNRIENLELWVSNHPSGQRASDKLQHGMEMIAEYGCVDDAIEMCKLFGLEVIKK